MRKIHTVFLSFAHRDRALAEELSHELRAHGITTVSSAELLTTASDWQRTVEHAVKSADAIIVLVDAKVEPNQYQQFEWSTALAAEWDNPQRRLIPLVLGKAELPSFLSNRQALRVRDPKTEWGRAVEELVRVLQDEDLETGRFVSTEREDPAKRRERLRSIEEAAETMKTP